MAGGGMLLPGQRFCPMEDELLLCYLKPKVNGMQVPGNQDVICELDLYGDQEPWKIWKRFEARKANDLRRNKDLYFFTKKKKKSARSSRISRTVGKGGTWKGQNAAKKVFLLDQNQQPTKTLLGFKKTFTYKNSSGSPHDGGWILYEFELDKSQILRKNKQVNKNDYVLCLLRKNDLLPEKKRKRQQQQEDEEEEDDGDRTDPESEEEPQRKRQRLLPSLEAEQERFLLPAPSFVAEQEFLLQLPAPSATTTLEDEAFCFQQFEVDEILKWLEEENEARPANTLEADEQVALQPLQVEEENSGLQLQEWEAEPQPLYAAADDMMNAPEYLQVEQMGVEENSGLQFQEWEAEPQQGGQENLDVPLYAVDYDMMNSLEFPQVEQMGIEANVYGGNLNDSMVGVSSNDMGEWNAAAFSDFESMPSF